jgi:hypothetical protein
MYAGSNVARRLDERHFAGWLSVSVCKQKEAVGPKV